MYKNVIFDFGQVIVRFDPLYMTKKYLNIEEDINLVMQVVFDRLYWDRLDMGSITDQELKAEVCKRLPENLHKSAIAVYDHWYENIPLIDGICELLTELKENGTKLYLLSNISVGFAENYHKNPEIKKILELFDGLVFSGKLRIVKPDFEIFRHITEKYRLSKNSTLFVDDNIANIKGAQNFGIEGYLFDGDVKALRKFLRG